MNPYLSSLLLGALQGFTEFLPVSSSGHLVLLQHWLPINGDDEAFDVALHVGTLVPVIVLFRDDLLHMLRAPFSETGPMFSRPGVKWALYVVLASIPTAIMGLGLEKRFEAMTSFASLSWQFAVTAIALQLSATLKPGTKDVSEMTWWHAVAIGVAQGIAIVPAISRSGLTVVASMLFGLRRDVAGRFSFVISIPAIAGAALLKARKVDVDPAVVPQWLLGAGVALVVGWISLVFLMKVIRQGNFSKFAWYCWGMTALTALLAITGW